MSSHWEFQQNGEVRGPVDAKTLKSMARQGLIGADTLVRKEDSHWVRAATVKGLMESASGTTAEDDKSDTSSSSFWSRTRALIARRWTHTVAATVFTGCVLLMSYKVRMMSDALTAARRDCEQADQELAQAEQTSASQARELIRLRSALEAQAREHTAQLKVVPPEIAQQLSALQLEVANLQNEKRNLLESKKTLEERLLVRAEPAPAAPMTDTATPDSATANDAVSSSRTSPSGTVSVELVNATGTNELTVTLDGPTKFNRVLRVDEKAEMALVPGQYTISWLSFDGLTGAGGVSVRANISVPEVWRFTRSRSFNNVECKLTVTPRSTPADTPSQDATVKAGGNATPNSSDPAPVNSSKDVVDPSAKPPATLTSKQPTPADPDDRWIQSAQLIRKVKNNNTELIPRPRSAFLAVTCTIKQAMKSPFDLNLKNTVARDAKGKRYPLTGIDLGEFTDTMSAVVEPVGIGNGVAQRTEFASVSGNGVSFEFDRKKSLIHVTELPATFTLFFVVPNQPGSFQIEKLDSHSESTEPVEVAR